MDDIESSLSIPSHMPNWRQLKLVYSKSFDNFIIIIIIIFHF